jgi:dihydropyrimidinase
VDKVDLLIKNAAIVSSGGRARGSILIHDQKIVGILDGPALPEAVKTIDARGRAVIPGVIDPHTHPGGKFPLWDDFRTETPAAAAGGVTTIGVMHGAGRANRDYKEFTTPEDTVPWSRCFPVAREIGEENSLVDFFYSPYINTIEQAEDIPRIAEEFGLTSYKIYANLRSPATTHVGPNWNARIGIPVSFDDGLIWLTFKQASAIGPQGMVLIHNENTEVAAIEMKRLQAEGRNDPAAWSDRSPTWAEAEHITRYGRFAIETNCRYYVVHLSSAAGLRAAIRARQDGCHIWVESCPQYLVRTKHDPPGVLLKVNPPIRDKEDNELLWHGLIEHQVDCMGTDHVVTSLHEKTVKGDTSGRTSDPTKDVWSTGSGFVGLDTFLPIMLSEGVHKGRLTLEQVVGVLCENNAKAFGLYPRKGVIQVGSDADLVILDLDKTKVVTAADLHCSADFTIYEGMEVTGWPATTILRGRVIFDDGQVFDDRGYAKYLPRDAKAQVYERSPNLTGGG